MHIIEQLKSKGHHIKKQGRTWGSNFCPRCGEGSKHSNKLCAFVGRDGKERWFCHACGERGDLADLLAALHGITLKEALGMVKSTLPSKATEVVLPREDEGSENLDQVRAVIRALLDGLPHACDEAMQYLAKRGIEAAVVRQAAQRGLLRMLPADPFQARDTIFRVADPSSLKATGLWGGSSDTWPAMAFRPLLFFTDTSVEMRRINTDERFPKSIRVGKLTKPFAWRGDPSRVVVVEGAIDMLSLVQLGERRTILALPGVNAYRIEWFEAASKRYGSRFHIAFDADRAGRLAARRLINELQARGIDAERLEPAQGKDWNDMLLASTA